MLSSRRPVLARLFPDFFRLEEPLTGAARRCDSSLRAEFFTGVFGALFETAREEVAWVFVFADWPASANDEALGVNSEGFVSGCAVCWGVCGSVGATEAVAGVSMPVEAVAIEFGGAASPEPQCASFGASSSSLDSPAMLSIAAARDC
jgi:hypothetical protein